MNPNKRIFLNVMATYGRSLYALVVGLFTSRWVLMSLGQVDFGLYGVVGGLTVFIEFFNNIMSMAVVRFYAVTVGAANLQSQTEGVNECRRWFSIAVFLHTIVPISLMLLGYPVGEWAVKHFLNIPTERIYICVWVAGIRSVRHGVRRSHHRRSHRHGDRHRRGLRSRHRAVRHGCHGCRPCRRIHPDRLRRGSCDR